MAKTKKLDDDQNKDPWEVFTGVETKDGNWTIVYNPKTRRAMLKEKDEFKVSDMCVTTLLNIASTRYGIQLENWRKTKNG